MNGPDANRTRHVVIGAGLLALVIVILGVAWILNDRLRPEVGVTSSAENTSPVAEVASPTVAVTEPDAAASPTPDTAVDESPSAELTVEQEVEQAYLRYWEVRSQAFYELDTTRLSEVMAGAELERTKKRIEELEAANQAAKIDVELNYLVVDIGPDTASIQDQYLNRSYLVDAATKQPLQSPGEGQIEVVAYQLQLIDGAWKVVDGVQVRR